MWNLKKGQTETDADSQTLKNLWSPEETVWWVVGCVWALGWKSVKSDCYDHYTTTDVINSFEKYMCVCMCTHIYMIKDNITIQFRRASHD